MKRRILIALSTSRYSKKLIATALEEAQKWCSEGDNVLVDVLYIIEVEELKQISDRVGNEAFLGSTMQQDLLEALGQEHHRMALQRIEELSTQAKDLGCSVEITEDEGEFSKKVIEHADGRNCDVIYMTRDDRPFISRFLFGSDVDRIARLARKEGLGRVVIGDHEE